VESIGASLSMMLLRIILLSLKTVSDFAEMQVSGGKCAIAFISKVEVERLERRLTLQAIRSQQEQL